MSGEQDVVVVDMDWLAEGGGGCEGLLLSSPVMPAARPMMEEAWRRGCHRWHRVWACTICGRGEAARSMGDGVAGVRRWQRDLAGGHLLLIKNALS